MIDADATKRTTSTLVYSSHGLALHEPANRSSLRRLLLFVLLSDQGGSWKSSLQLMWRYEEAVNEPLLISAPNRILSCLRQRFI